MDNDVDSLVLEEVKVWVVGGLRQAVEKFCHGRLQKRDGRGFDVRRVGDLREGHDQSQELKNVSSKMFQGFLEKDQSNSLKCRALRN